MGRYSNASVTLTFPDLTADGDDLIFVTIRNPKTVPMEKLIPADVPTDAEGERDKAAVTTSTYEMMAGLITGWHVYDATVDEDTPALTLPATADSIRVLPMDIIKKIMEEIGSVVSTPR